MDLVKITQLMDKFEKQFVDLDVKTGVMDDAMGATMAASVPDGEVESLMSAVKDEHAIEVDLDFGVKAPTATPAGASQEVEADLTNRLAALRNADDG